jgi:hypothetical protein
MLVSDPSDPTEARDYFVSRFHHLAHDLLFRRVPRDDQIVISTALPLVGTDPLVGMRSMSCASFTAFGLLFKTEGPAWTEISKYSNGSTGVNVRVQRGEIDTRVHLKSSGFDETASGRVAFNLDENSSGVSGQLRLDFTDLNGQVPSSILLGSSYRISKAVHLVSQSNHDLSSVFAGLKFMPCGHMHAGVGIELRNRLSKQEGTSATTVLHTSGFCQTHSGGSFGFIAGMGKNDVDLRIGGTTKLFSWMPNHQNQEADEENSNSVAGSYNIPSPVVGWQYDLGSRTVSSYVDVGLSAGNGAKSRIHLDLKFGLKWIPGKALNEPAFSVQVSGYESR